MNEQLRGLGSVRVGKKFLREKLKGNLEIHTDTYKKAMGAWHDKIIFTLENELRKAKKNKTYQPNVFVAKPISYESAYNKIIDMLDASLDSEFELTSKEFSQYVRDDWEWKSGFITTVSGCYGDVD